MKLSFRRVVGGATALLVPLLLMVVLATDIAGRLSSHISIYNNAEPEPRHKRSAPNGEQYIYGKAYTKHTVFYNSVGRIQSLAVNKQKYPVLHNPSKMCDSNTFLIICIFSSPHSIERRNVIRKTWASDLILDNNSVRLVFLLGESPQEYVNLRSAIKSEHVKYDDIIQHKYVDSYRNLTTKAIIMTRWVLQHCNSAKYVLKADEDVLVNIPRLVSFLLANTCKTCLIGQKISRAKPLRDRRAKWYTSVETYSARYYPTYLSGTAYVIPASLLTRLNHVIMHTRPFWLEDIYVTGICAPKVGGRLVDNIQFNGIMTSRTPLCDHRHIASHGFTSVEMLNCWDKINYVI